MNAGRLRSTDRLMSQSDVTKLLGCTKDWVLKQRRRGAFPEPYLLGDRSVKFVEREVHEWLEGHREGADEQGATEPVR